MFVWRNSLHSKSASKSVSQLSVEISANLQKIYINLVAGFMIDLKTFLSSDMPNQHLLNEIQSWFWYNNRKSLTFVIPVKGSGTWGHVLAIRTVTN